MIDVSGKWRRQGYKGGTWLTEGVDEIILSKRTWSTKISRMMTHVGIFTCWWRCFSTKLPLASSWLLFPFLSVNGQLDEPLAQLSDCPILCPQPLHAPAPSATWDGGSQGKNADSDHQGWVLGTVKGGGHVTLHWKWNCEKLIILVNCE